MKKVLIVQNALGLDVNKMHEVFTVNLYGATRSQGIYRSFAEVCSAKDSHISEEQNPETGEIPW
jgi:hypothetical protein